MRSRWRLVIPIVGLMCFGAETYHSYRFNQELGSAPRKYYWWSSIRLDTDPLNKNPTVPSLPSPCKSGTEDCGWEPRFLWVDAGLLTESLMLLALPAFVLGAISVSGLGRLGVNEVWSFILLMPLFVFAWFYFGGWLVDRWVRKRRERLG
jgi:hypothetical protein